MIKLILTSILIAIISMAIHEFNILRQKRDIERKLCEPFSVSARFIYLSREYVMCSDNSIKAFLTEI